MEAKYKAKKFISNSAVVKYPQDIGAYARLMRDMTECIGWVRTEESEKRMRVALDALAEYILGQFDKSYEPEEHTYVFSGHKQVETKWEVKAESDEEARKKFPSVAGEGATWYTFTEKANAEGGGAEC